MSEIADLTVDDVRIWVPAKDFRRSRSFYLALGWTEVWSDGEGLAMLELAGHRFMLQDFYVKQWAHNFVMTIAVRDATAWYERVRDLLESGEHEGARVAEPEREDWGATITHVWDPSGVLLHLTQFDG